MSQFTLGLNAEQQRAVESTDGPLLILAGAGSGKTKTLTHRIAHLLDTQLATQYEILAVTFTNKAAKEMRERVAQLLAYRRDDKAFMPYMGTFHGICVRILRKDGQYSGVPNNFVIFDESDRTTLIKQLSKQLSIDEKQHTARAIGAIISAAKNDLITSAEYASLAQTPTQRAAARVYPLYQQALKDHAALDFDDLIGKVVSLLENNAEVRARWQDRFKYILIDEYQDTNTAQYKLIKLLLNEKRNICVVGDDWQSIYSWRGADFKNILNFERDFKNATVIRLEQNYRSTNHILDAAHAVIAKNAQRSDKKLWTAISGGAPVQVLSAYNERHEAEQIIQIIRQRTDTRTFAYKNIALLYRTNAQSRALEEQFVRFNIPYKMVGGARFYDRTEIKDILAYLRLLYQPEDIISFQRIVNTPTRGFGKTSLDKFLQWRQVQGLTLTDALDNVDTSPLTARAKQALFALHELLSVYRQEMDHLSAASLLESVIKRLDYYNYLDDGTLQSEARIENVKELLSVAKAYSDEGLASFLEEVALVSDLDTLNPNSDAVTLMTLHAAKGLEYDVVFMTGMEESIFPHSRALFDQSQMEEERRLCYVGMTRAKKELYLTYADSRVLYGGVQHYVPSRFIAEINAQHIKKAAYTGYASAGVLDNNQPESSEPRYVPELHPGDTVNHQVFGRGIVVDLDGEVAAVQFGGKGIKRLNISFAPLEKVS
ncbi:MAG TPA: UvrD-helicase domain-containing protein [Candidatus Saccharibacteria bacterium]|nr:UvrD-helicase domain-containing protein [Candidatus Saccharibacteria bacterium]MCB9817548.1 UvrD-helicase domain-containing protein [Candidatus Nomurabacteria bacterium]HPD98846.1 UvrD-helicase domain-containing protein [Candidatus Saccharibacteria bacterium]HPR09947.1 UvrD-helicase domain-containing protein [Candidatus Saccharibacteria bacterium]